MPCCKAEEYDWCKDEPIVDYKDDEGREYCVFHAPQGTKGVPGEGFNILIMRAINTAVQQKAICDLSGTIFEDAIDFGCYGKIKPLPRIIFNNAQFNGPTKFNGTYFGGDAHFSKVCFSYETSFFEAQFIGEADFNGSIFRSDAYFASSQFNRETSFSSAHFIGRVNFESVKFKDNVSFTQIIFDNIVEFDYAEFSKEAYLGSTQFLAEASFNVSIFNGMSNFNFAQFHKKTEFVKVQFNRGAKFAYTEFKGLVYFSGAHFNGEVDFLESKFFHCVDLQRLIIHNKIRLEKVDLTKVLFLGTDVRKIDFINCTWNIIKGRKVLYDEMRLSGKNQKVPSNKDGCRKVATIYRRLKQKYKEEHNEPEVSEWHFGEREVQRKGRLFNNKFMLILSNLYWLSSGYGERAGKAAWVLLIIIVLLSSSFGLSGLTSVNEAGIHGIKSINLWNDFLSFNDYWMLIVNTFQYAIFKTPYFKPASILGEYLKLFTQIVVPVQIALFALAVRNKFRR